MCGRFSLTLSLAELIRRFGLPATGASEVPPPRLPRFNVAPAQVHPVLLAAAASGEAGLRLESMRWGLALPWETGAGPAPAHSPINVRVESLRDKPGFRPLCARERRCLVPADGFYEWPAGARGRTRPGPLRFTVDDGRVFAFAGIWQPAADGADTFALLTTAANPRVAVVHDRMPVILPPELEAPWIHAGPAEFPRLLAAVTQPFPAARMTGTRLDAWVNSPAHDDPACLRTPPPPAQPELLL